MLTLPTPRASEELRAWLAGTGLKDKKLEGALAVCEQKEVEDVSDLRMMMQAGNLEGSFHPVTLSYINNALLAQA